MPSDVGHTASRAPAPPHTAAASWPIDEVLRLQYEVNHLKRALESREVIGMAKGILMARQCCAPHEAFDILARASQRENRKLADVAKRIVEENSTRRGSLTA